MKKSLIRIGIAAASTGIAASLTSVTAFAEGSAAATAQPSAGSSILTLVVPLVIMFGLLYFMAIKPQKKRDQELKDMQANLQVGDEIITSGGIVGIIARIGDDTVVIETGGERHKLRIKTWAIAENVTASERAKAASSKAKVKAAKVEDDEEDAEKPEKKSKKKKNNEDED